jgi:hypothetical protein
MHCESRLCCLGLNCCMLMHSPFVIVVPCLLVAACAQDIIYVYLICAQLSSNSSTHFFLKQHHPTPHPPKISP